MKHNYFIAILLMAFLTSCSSDDATTEPDDTNPIEADYFPLENSAFWVYDVSGEFPGRDSLYTANDTMINNTSYKKFKTKDVAFGFFSGSLAENGVRKSGDKLLVSGSTGVNLIQDFPIDLTVTDFVIFKESASENEQLGLTSGNFTYNYGEIPLKFDYTMKSIAGQSLASYAVPNYGTFQDVKVVKIIVNLKISAEFSAGGITIPAAILAPQDVLVSTQYYAKNIGMIHSSTDINYELEDFSMFNFEFPFPTTGSQNIKEYLANSSTQE